MIQTFALITLLAAGAQAPAAPPAQTPAAAVVGDWLGTLDAGGAKLRLAVHISKKYDGTLKALIDSLDQGAIGIPVDTATFADGKLNLDVSKIGASYEGTLAANKTEIKGTWSQGGGSLPLDLAKGTAPAAAAAAPAAPDKPVPSDPIRPLWLGTLNAGGTPLRMVVHLTPAADGTLTATVDSPDQGATGLPVERAIFKDHKLTLELKQLGARFEGTANAEGNEVSGQWFQAGGAMPLTLKPIEKAPEGATGS